MVRRQAAERGDEVRGVVAAQLDPAVGVEHVVGRAVLDHARIHARRGVVVEINAGAHGRRGEAEGRRQKAEG